MWAGVTYVDPTRNPIIHEGFERATVVVTNAGPGGVLILGWSSHQPTGDPGIRIQLRPGNTGAISANLVRAQFLSGISEGASGVLPSVEFTTIAWRILT